MSLKGRNEERKENGQEVEKGKEGKEKKMWNLEDREIERSEKLCGLQKCIPVVLTVEEEEEEEEREDEENA